MSNDLMMETIKNASPTSTFARILLCGMYMPMHVAELIAYIVSLEKKIFYLFYKTT
jgi:hypothetical protein